MTDRLSQSNHNAAQHIARFDQRRLLSLIENLAGQRVMVVGDVMLDEYLYGQVNRLSREAPVPVVEFERRDYVLGGAANPAANVAALESQAVQVGVVGNDSDAAILREMLTVRGIDPTGLVTDPTRPTTTKTRIMAQMGLRYPQQVARIDWVSRQPVEGQAEQAVLAHVRALSGTVRAIMLSDYLNGLLTETVVATVRNIALDRGLLVTADAQGELSKYQGLDTVKCNADEAMAYVRRPLRTDEDFAMAAISIAAGLKLRGAMLITRGAEGITIASRERAVTHVRAPKVEDVFDTVGAGDTVLAVLTLALAAGGTHAEAAALANLAAGVVVRRVGNYAPRREELRDAAHEMLG